MLNVAGIEWPSRRSEATLLTDDRPSRMPWFQQPAGGPPVTQMKIGLPSAAALMGGSQRLPAQGICSTCDSSARGLISVCSAVNGAGKLGRVAADDPGVSPAAAAVRSSAIAGGGHK